MCHSLSSYSVHPSSGEYYNRMLRLVVGSLRKLASPRRCIKSVLAPISFRPDLPFYFSRLTRPRGRLDGLSFEMAAILLTSSHSSIASSLLFHHHPLSSVVAFPLQRLITARETKPALRMSEVKIDTAVHFRECRSSIAAPRLVVVAIKRQRRTDLSVCCGG